MTPLHVFSATVAEMFHGTVTVNSHLNAATNRAYALAAGSFATGSSQQ
jgi:hypothetical protein